MILMATFGEEERTLARIRIRVCCERWGLQNRWMIDPLASKHDNKRSIRRLPGFLWRDVLLVLLQQNFLCQLSSRCRKSRLWLSCRGAPLPFLDLHSPSSAWRAKKMVRFRDWIYWKMCYSSRLESNVNCMLFICSTQTMTSWCVIDVTRA